MSKQTLFSVVESPLHPNFSTLYSRLGFEELRLSSVRKAISQQKRTPPTVIVADFIYGYSNNYSGVHISNLDVLLVSLQKYAPQARVIALVEKPELQYAERLAEMFPLHGVLANPVSEAQMAAVLADVGAQ